MSGFTRRNISMFVFIGADLLILPLWSTRRVSDPYKPTVTDYPKCGLSVGDHRTKARKQAYHCSPCPPSPPPLLRHTSLCPDPWGGCDKGYCSGSIQNTRKASAVVAQHWIPHPVSSTSLAYTVSETPVARAAPALLPCPLATRPPSPMALQPAGPHAYHWHVDRRGLARIPYTRPRLLCPDHILSCACAI